jgi:glycerophosphoryl diester phosphodiesterase
MTGSRTHPQQASVLVENCALALLVAWEPMMVAVAWRQSAVWIAIAAILFLLVIAAILSWIGRPLRGPQITAHRGGAAVAPENTLAAARQAIADGFDWIEIDVHESRDGEVMVFHDKDLKRIGGVESLVWETDAAELQKVDVGSYFSLNFKDERMPTLGQLLDVCKGKIGVNIELKHFGHNQKLEERVAEIVTAHGMDDQVMSMSFDADAVRRMKSLRPDWRVGWLTKEPVAEVSRIDADFLGIVHEHVTPGLIQAAHRRGLPVFVWTVNDPAMAAKVASLGADMIITDNPVMVRDALKELSAKSQ